jgi:hypothetical protein
MKLLRITLTDAKGKDTIVWGGDDASSAAHDAHGAGKTTTMTVLLPDHTKLSIIWGS